MPIMTLKSTAEANRGVPISVWQVLRSLLLFFAVFYLVFQTGQVGQANGSEKIVAETGLDSEDYSNV